MVRRIAIGILAGLLVTCGLAAVSGCNRRAAPAATVTLRWLAARPMPAFDPDGPPEPLRGALERMLTCGLFERDSAGALHGAAVESTTTSEDGRTITLHLRARLRFTDGSPVTSEDVRRALLAGLARDDHATRAWLLGAVTGMERVRAGRPLPALGIEAPEARTVVLHLSHPDALLADKLASPGMALLWKSRTVGSWGQAIGVGPYRVAGEEPGRGLTLVRADSGATCRAAVDTVLARFLSGAPRTRTLLRRGGVDLVWPLPPGLVAVGLPAGYARSRLDAWPARRLVLVFRADVPPTTRLPARHALAHALNLEVLSSAFGQHAGAAPWLDGAPPFEPPAFDAATMHEWLHRGRLGASFHVVLAYDADGPAAEIARILQGQWAAQGLYAELRPLRGAEAAAAPLRAAAAQAQLVETQAPLAGAAAELATLVMPLRGPAVGRFRTGWRTREFDPWIGTGSAPGRIDAAQAQARLGEERIALPIATLPWEWVALAGGQNVHFAPDRGPQFDLH